MFTHKICGFLIENHVLMRCEIFKWENKAYTGYMITALNEGKSLMIQIVKI